MHRISACNSVVHTYSRPHNQLHIREGKSNKHQFFEITIIQNPKAGTTEALCQTHQCLWLLPQQSHVLFTCLYAMQDYESLDCMDCLPPTLKWGPNLCCKIHHHHRPFLKVWAASIHCVHLCAQRVWPRTLTSPRHHQGPGEIEHHDDDSMVASTWAMQTRHEPKLWPGHEYDSNTAIIQQ